MRLVVNLYVMRIYFNIILTIGLLLAQNYSLNFDGIDDYVELDSFNEIIL